MTFDYDSPAELFMPTRRVIVNASLSTTDVQNTISPMNLWSLASSICFSVQACERLSVIAGEEARTVVLNVLRWEGAGMAQPSRAQRLALDRPADTTEYALFSANGLDADILSIWPAKRENIDDMSFIRTLIARASIEQAIDEKQVFAFG